MKNSKLMTMSLMAMMLSITICSAQKPTEDISNNEILYSDYAFVFPIKVKKENGRIITIKNEKQLDKQYKKISTVAELNYVFPLTVEFDDGYQEVITDIDTLYALEEYDIDEAYDEYEEEYITDGDFEFVFPISVKKEDGEIVTVNSEIELDTLYKNITEYSKLNYNFPLTIEFEDGYQEVITDADTLYELLYTSSCEEY